MKKTIQVLGGAAAAMLLATGIVAAQQMTVDINKVSDAGVGEKIGTVTITEGKQGTTFKVAVSGIATGKHGFHVHEKGDCGTAMKAGKTEAGGAAGAPLRSRRQEDCTRALREPATKATSPC